MTLHLLKRLLLNLLVLPHDLYEWARDSARRARQYGAAVLGEREGSLAKQPAWKRAAIVAFYPNRHSLPFLCNLLDGLAENGFFVLAITESSLPEDLKASVCARCHHLIERFPFGRDFGSYKAGWEWLQTRSDLRDIDTLALVNDSLYYTRHIGATIAEVLGQKADWLCLFENFQTLYHAQSFFQIFRAPVFRSAAFTNFWRRYVPSSARMRVITKGEVGLTRALLDGGFEPRAWYNSVRLRADILDRLSRQAIAPAFEDTLNLTFDFGNRNKDRRPPATRQDFLSLLPADVAHKVGVLAEKYNPTHAVGLLCNYLYQAPIKRDICYRDVLAMSDLITLAQGFSAEEKESMFFDLRRKGVPANFAGIRKIPQRILWKAGRI